MQLQRLDKLHDGSQGTASTHKNRILAMGMAIVFLGVCSSGCSNAKPTQSSLELHRKQWEGARNEAYRYQVGYAVGGIVEEDSWWRSLLEITVVGKEVVQVRRLDTGQVDTQDVAAYPSIDALFDIIGEEVRNQQEEIRVTYDPVHRFPELIHVGNVAVDYGYQYAVYGYEGLDPANLGLQPAQEKRDPKDLVLCRGIKRTWEQTRRLLELERSKREGLVCVWDLGTGQLEMYGGDGDTGNNVEVQLIDQSFALLAPAASSKAGYRLYDEITGRFQKQVAWMADFTLRAGGALSGDASRYVAIEAEERDSLRKDGFVTASATKGARIRQIDGSTGEDLQRMALGNELHFGAKLHFSPDDQLFAIAMTPAKHPTASLVHDVVQIRKTGDGSLAASYPGRFLAFSLNGQQVALATTKQRAGHALVVWDIAAGTRKVLRESPSPHPNRFGAFTPEGMLVVDVSANHQSVRLDLETLDPLSGKSLSQSQLPAVPWGDKWSFSPDASNFARLGRNLAGRPVIEVFDIATEKLLRRFEYAETDTDGRPHVVGDVVLLSNNRLLTTHPKVIWNCAP